MTQLFVLFIQYNLSYYLGYFISAICVYTKAYNHKHYNNRNNNKPSNPINYNAIHDVKLLITCY